MVCGPRTTRRGVRSAALDGSLPRLCEPRGRRGEEETGRAQTEAMTKIDTTLVAIKSDIQEMHDKKTA
ncbi:MAG: hypothetical protein FWD73_08190 [Polyangiaceae bacterium]|nr:hypothetical protein [Polyangiaceae bacterium]